MAHFLDYRLGINSVKWFDLSRGAKIDFWLTAQERNVKGLLIQESF